MAAQKAADKPAEKQQQGAPGGAENLEQASFDSLNELAAEEAANDYQPGEGGDEKPAKPAGGVGAKELQALYQMGFALAAARLGDHWVLSDAEAKEIGEATDAVLEKYGAKMNIGPEFTLVLTGAMITGPRILQTMYAEKPKKLENSGEQGGQESGGKAKGGADGDK
jgi:hypothetical protein